MAGSLSCRKIFFGLISDAEVRAESIQEEETAIRFTLKVRGQRVLVRLAVPGRFQVLNALAAAAVAYTAGASLDQIAAGLAAFRPVAMRMQVLTHPSGALLINDAYNANPSSVRSSVMSFCRGYAQRSRWLVLGDMRELGGGAKQEHHELGLWLATQPVERILLYGRDMRFALEALATKPSPSLSVERFRKKRKLLAELQRSLTGKQVVLFKGSRAMKLEDVVGALLPL
jgi:UDP-N-acetylmuramoyl-tripeptide--D-alanyl-D-alanine ligase